MPNGFAARQQQVQRLREYVAVYEQLVAAFFHRFARAQRVHHRHRFGRRRAFVQQRAVADFHARQRDDRGLEVQQRFQAALRDFRLIGVYEVYHAGFSNTLRVIAAGTAVG